MNSIANQLASLSSNLWVGEGFHVLGFSFPGLKDDSLASGLGVSMSAAPLISAPMARQAAEFQALIAPPTRPSNPSIAPPTVGREANAVAAPDALLSSPQSKLAHFAATRL